MESWYKITLEEEYERNAELTEEMVSEMRKWLEEQPHLPQSLADVELIYIIQSCDYDLEQAKKALDINYTIRSKADFFKNRDPTSEEIERSLQVVQQLALYNVNEEGNHCVLSKLVDPDPAKYNAETIMRYNTMISDFMRIENGTTPGLIVIADAKGFTLTHMFKASLSSIRYYMRYVQEGTPVKLVQHHVVNTAGSIIEKALIIMKPFMNEKSRKIMHFHSGYETIYDHGIRRDKMPIEYGGTAGTLKQLTDDFHNRMKNYKEYFEQAELIRVDETKRPRTKYFGWF